MPRAEAGAATPERAGKLAMIARWKPLHLGHAAVLRALARRADRVVVGIGSSNRYNAKNPFTAAETAAMIRLVVPDAARVAIVDVPDLDDGPRWRAMVLGMLGPLDAFVTANGYVRSLLMTDYAILHPRSLLDDAERVRASGTQVRVAMARGGDGWRELVPPEVAGYLDAHDLVARFRRESGAETLALAAMEGDFD